MSARVPRKPANGPRPDRKIARERAGSVRLVLLGAPRTKKTSNSIRRYGKRLKVVPSDAWMRWRDAALRGLRTRFFRVEEDHGAKREWKWRMNEVLHPLSEQVRHLLEGAFTNWRILKVYVADGGDGPVEYVVGLETREPSQEVAVAARIAALTPPEPYSEIGVTFTERSAP